MHVETAETASEQDTKNVGRRLAASLRAGDVVLVSGELGAGKTTFVRGVLEGLGWVEPVRSPTFNLIQTFDTSPAVMHADLYRVKAWEGIGLEDYLATHLCLIEWPDRAAGLVPEETAWRVEIAFNDSGRTIVIRQP